MAISCKNKETQKVSFLKKFDSQVHPEILELLKKVGQTAPRSTLLLHLPKTGGSTTESAVRKSEIVDGLLLPPVAKPMTGPCGCADAACSRESKRRSALVSASRRAYSNKTLMITIMGHTTYDVARQMTDALGSSSQSHSVLTLVRPCRQRVISAFRDYWSQVDEAKERKERERGKPINSESRHTKNKQFKYLEDSRHYEDEEGNIDGVAWFTAFREHGSGVPFFIDDVFDGNFKLFKKQTNNERLRLYPTSNVDQLTLEITQKVQPRTRVSNTPTRAILQAIEDASEIIDELSLRDAKFDNFIANKLNLPDFKPSETNRVFHRR